MNESAASTTLKRIALFKVNKVPYLLEFNINDDYDDFQPKSSAKPAHFNKNQPKILTAKIMWYDFITMSIKINKDHFYLLKIK